MRLLDRDHVPPFPQVELAKLNQRRLIPSHFPIFRAPSHTQQSQFLWRAGNSAHQPVKIKQNWTLVVGGADRARILQNTADVPPATSGLTGPEKQAKKRLKLLLFILAFQILG